VVRPEWKQTCLLILKWLNEVSWSLQLWRYVTLSYTSRTNSLLDYFFRIWSNTGEFYKHVKVKRALCLLGTTPSRHMRKCRHNCILNFCTIQMCVVSFTPLSIYAWLTSCWHPPTKRLLGRAASRDVSEKTQTFILSRGLIQFFGSPARSVVSVSTELSRPSPLFSPLWTRCFCFV